MTHGSKDPRQMTTSSIRWHLNKQHPEVNLDSGANNNEASTRSTNESSSKKRGWTPTVPLWKLRSKKQRTDMFSCTIPGWVESKTTLDINHPRAQRIHKWIFETMILDLVPFREVDKPGFLRHHALLCPNFEVASAKYYRQVLQ